LATQLCACGSLDTCVRHGQCRKCRGRKDRDVPATKPLPAPTAPASKTTVEQDREKLRVSVELSAVRVKYAEALQSIERLEKERDAAVPLRKVQPCVIREQHGKGTSEATILVNASDWHLEERVDPDTINGMNNFNLDIARKRVQTFFNATVRLTRLLQQDVKVERMVMGLLGDFISGDIHEEIAEVCQLPPMEAVGFAQDLLAGGIEFMLAHTSLKFRFQCHSGNHGRTTKTTRFSTENGHSLEYLLYRHLASYFRHEDRVEFEIAKGPHSYVEIYGRNIRYQHGHMVKYNGGVGGIYIPVNKAIGEWNKGIAADIDMFGHFHQQLDGNSFVANGSLIGYNSFALSIKAPFDVPKQTMTLMDKKRGRTCVWPILL
jgi:hypothetical protein